MMGRRYTHDDAYYFEDGSCILLVEDVLFNVSSSPLVSLTANSFYRSTGRD
jgi:hypothetical protein